MSDIPKIAITSESEEDDNFMNIAEALTDVEAMEDEPLTIDYKQKFVKKNKLKIKLTDDTYTTDYEDYEASDTDDDVKLVKHTTPVSLDDLYLENTIEESFKSEINKDKHKKMKKSITQLKTENNQEACKGVTDTYTDEECFNTDSEMEPVEETQFPNVDFEHYNEAMNVSEKIKLSQEDCLENLPNDNLKVSQLSILSLSPNLSDLTDVEVLQSDSNDEVDSKKISKSRRRRRRSSRKYSATDVEDLEISEDEIESTFQGRRTHMKEILLNTVVKSQSLNFNSDNEDDGFFRFPICKKTVKKRGILQVPNFDKNILTDTEDLEGEIEDISPMLEYKAKSDSSFVERLDDISSCYSQTTEVNKLLKNKSKRQKYNIAIAQQDTDSGNDQSCEDKSIERQCVNFNICLSPRIKTKAMKKNQNVAKLSLNEDTDCELVDSESDEEESEPIPEAVVRQNLTEDEEFEADESGPTNHLPEIELPPPSRNLVILKENNPLPTIHILPLDDEASNNLQLDELSTLLTDEESISEAEDALETLCTTHTPEMPPLDFGFVEIAETLEQKLKVVPVDNDSVTDTEDIVIENKEKRRRAPKFKYLYGKFSENKHKLTEYKETPLLTDTEDIYLSEGNVKHLATPQAANDGGTDVENLESSEDDKEMGSRPRSCTPQHMREIGDETVVVKEGQGPFSKEDRLSVNQHTKKIKQTTVSPVNTDSEEMITSGDEENINDSRADTDTPNQVHQEFDGMSSSKVHSEAISKFDVDELSEVMYLKGGGYIERSTDVEDISEDDCEFNKSSDDDVKEDYQCLFVSGDEKRVLLNIRDGVVSFGRNEEWGASRKPAQSEPEPKKLEEDAAQQGGEEATTSVVREPPAPVRAEGEEAEKDESGSERRVADQHQLSEEMKALLKELERESKQ